MYNHERILLVEHEANNLEPLSRLLRLYGYVVKTATSLCDGLKLAGRETFDVIVSDVALPDGPGVELLKHARTRQPVRGIAVNPQVDAKFIQDCTDAGFLTCLQKPLLFGDLVRAIDQPGSPSV